MQVRADQIVNSLKRGLAPLYFVSGDEPLLVQECCDHIRRAANAADFSERDIHHVDNRYNWERLDEAANTMSLFAEKKIIELRLTGKPSDKGKALLRYVANPPPDTLLLVISGKLDASAKKTKWYKQVEQAGVGIPIWPIEDKQLPSWINQRLSQHGLQMTPEALHLMAERVEGNLLAAAQEIEKLKLFADGNIIDVDTISKVVSNSARYNVFNIVDKALRGDAAEAIRAMNGLRGEGTEAIVILWALSREVRTLSELKNSIDNGLSMDAAFQKYRIWDKRKSLVRQALNHLDQTKLDTMILTSSATDCAIKGIGTGSPWDKLTSIILTLAGQPSVLEE